MLLSSLLDNKEWRVRYWWPAILLIGAFSYLYMLDGLHIPKIGDEAPYYHVTRLTAETGNWLPLQGEGGLQNTKPPLLFWQGMLSTNFSIDWTLWRLRLPIVLYSFLTAFLVFLLTQKITSDREKGYIASSMFLGFASTFQHGRPFLTNLPETFFVFLGFFLLLFFYERKTSWGIRHYALVGLSIGIATLYKSFVVVVPVGFALFLVSMAENRFSLVKMVKTDLVPVTTIVLVALLCFGLWPVLDPEPAKILEDFILGENVSKLGGNNYLVGLVSGPYPISRIWLGHLTNAGILMFVLAGAIILGLKSRADWTNQERALWLFVLAYLVVFSLPSQRQENYLLPTTPALAIIIALYWERFSVRSLRIVLAPVLVGLAVLTWLFLKLPANVGDIDSYNIAQQAFLAAILFIAVYSLVNAKLIRHSINLVVFGCFILLSVVLSPLESTAGRYPSNTVNDVSGDTLYMPSGFGPRHERYRFILPGTEIKGYSPNDLDHRESLLQQGYRVGIYIPLTENVSERYFLYGSRVDMRTRQTPGEVKEILLNSRLDLLFQREAIVSLKKLSS